MICPLLFLVIAVVGFFSVLIVDFYWLVFYMKKFERVSVAATFKLTLDFLPWCSTFGVGDRLVLGYYFYALILEFFRS